MISGCRFKTENETEKLMKDVNYIVKKKYNIQNSCTMLFFFFSHVDEFSKSIFDLQISLFKFQSDKSWLISRKKYEKCLECLHREQDETSTDGKYIVAFPR